MLYAARTHSRPKSSSRIRFIGVSSLIVGIRLCHELQIDVQASELLLLLLRSGAAMEQLWSTTQLHCERVLPW